MKRRNRCFICDCHINQDGCPQGKKCSKCGLEVCPQCAEHEGFSKKDGKCRECQLPDDIYGD